MVCRLEELILEQQQAAGRCSMLVASTACIHPEAVSCKETFSADKRNHQEQLLAYCRNHARHLERFPNVSFSAVCDLNFDLAQQRIANKLDGGEIGF